LFFEDNLSKIKKENCLSIAYTGSLHPRTREISCFVTVLEKVATIAPQVKIIFNYAGFQADIVEAEFSKRRLGKLLNNHGLLKRDQALELQKQADILLLIVYTGDDPEIGKSIRTGKVYEYLASGKPILAIAPRDWEMKEEIECDGVSKVFDKNQIDEMAQYLIDLASRSKIEINIEKRKEVIEKYLYKNLALKLEQELESLVREKERDQL
jgi:glycosyltransferase involved in cell wall biosynthesis